ncbi:branched-chain-amino-acid aminotransferase 5, chloroplastic [Selaginella moellendorffii]|nr:branched-chain-amino-acid aminotransferase 5, chloroplastic [Selaginella moellendorffii]|eukprot:XP_002990723.2 branched-chain-amino-acid aminotransferase 5, chloroplastic [Selaginella moellendorffii]
MACALNGSQLQLQALSNDRHSRIRGLDLCRSMPRIEISRLRQNKSLKIQAGVTVSTTKDTAALGSDIDWENIGFGIRSTDFMYVMKTDRSGEWRSGELLPFGNLELSPAAGVLNYGQGLFEGMKAYRTQDGSAVLFRPKENALRMISGAKRMCMPAPSVGDFTAAVKSTVKANVRWVPPHGKGSLYIRPLLIGSGAILGLAPAPEYSFIIYVSPVGNYFKSGLAPISLKVETFYHRAAPGGTGGVKTIGNYAPVLKTQLDAKDQGFSDVLYLDAAENKYVEEVSSCNIFTVKGNTISTPETLGTILPGITRKSIIELARDMGYKVKETAVTVEELLDADEVFCTGTAVVVNPVGSITYGDRRVTYSDGGVGKVSRALSTSLTDIQMGRSEDKFGWVEQL